MVEKANGSVRKFKYRELCNSCLAFLDGEPYVTTEMPMYRLDIVGDTVYGGGLLFFMSDGALDEEVRRDGLYLLSEKQIFVSKDATVTLERVKQEEGCPGNSICPTCYAKGLEVLNSLAREIENGALPFTCTQCGMSGAIKKDCPEYHVVMGMMQRDEVAKQAWQEGLAVGPVFHNCAEHKFLGLWRRNNGEEELQGG